MEVKVLKTAEKPLVSIICTSFNHEEFIVEALRSIQEQTYVPIEVILIDNGSKDSSQKLLQDWQKNASKNLEVKSIIRSQTINYCKSFNEGFNLCNGKYFLDFSTDDFLLPEHVSNCVEKLEANPTSSAVFSDAYIISQNKKKSFYARSRQGDLKIPVAEGWVYEKVVASHHILSSTMMIRSAYFEDLGRYDESLAYEDFDIIVRMARKYPIVFSNHLGVKKNEHPASFSREQYRAKTSRMLPSTLLVCQKIFEMNKSASENKALMKRVFYEWRQALISSNFKVAFGFLELSEKLSAKGGLHLLYSYWTKSQLDLSMFFPNRK
ncbi:MAG: glycosyltransferase [Mongoliibacter sp.]|nr:MAG: glycosyltransferase [Mongoliibacter sp.]